MINKLAVIVLMTVVVTGLMPYNILCGVLLLPIMLKEVRHD